VSIPGFPAVNYVVDACVSEAGNQKNHGN